MNLSKFEYPAARSPLQAKNIFGWRDGTELVTGILKESKEAMVNPAEFEGHNSSEPEGSASGY